MDTIWKYQLEITDRQEILMPPQAKILTAQAQDNILCLWVRVETDTNYGVERRKRVIEIIGTGNSMPELANYEVGRKYINTCVMGYFVWHVFEIELN